LLKAHAPGIFDSLPDSVWRDWVSCVIGYSPPESDESYATILGTAYKHAPNEFLQAFAQLIDGENDRCGAVFSLDRLMQVWSTAMAEVLRARLAKETKLKPHAFRAVLRALLKSGDRAARQLAKMWTGSASDQTGENNERATIAACQLLIHDSAIGWEAVWPGLEKYPAYARDVFLGLAQDHERGQLLERLREDQLAKLYIWLAQNAPAPGDDDDEDGRVTPSKALYQFRQWVIAYLAGRGTPAACVEIRRLSELLVDEALKWHLKSAEELMRRNTRASFAPKELIALASSSHAAAGALGNEDNVRDWKREAVILAVPKIYEIKSPPQHEKGLTAANDLLGALAPKPVRRHPENIKIDDALRKIAEMHPKDHEEVFNYLDGRVRCPNAEPFRSAGGWSAGFQKDKAGARAWLSKAWSELNLPPFRRGPK
jgi:hypothetical protein